MESGRPRPGGEAGRTCSQGRGVAHKCRTFLAVMGRWRGGVAGASRQCHPPLKALASCSLETYCGPAFLSSLKENLKIHPLVKYYGF